MPNSYTQCFFQIVFAVEKRQGLINRNIKDTIEKYISGIISGKNCKTLAIYCRPDHIHILIGLNPKISLSDIVKTIKQSSMVFINLHKLTPFQFNWQKGYGAFTYNKKDLPKIINYINNQDEHHRIKSIKEEYISFLDEYDIDYKPEFLFEF